MTQTRRRLSFSGFPAGRFAWKIEGWLLLAALSSFLVWVSPIGSPSSPASGANLALLSHLLFPLILWTWFSRGPLWGILTTAWSVIIVGLVALASRQVTLFWLVPEFVVFGFVTHHGITQWEGVVRSSEVETERLEAEINTSQEDFKRLTEGESGLRERLAIYQQLRQVANTFSASLPLGELIHQVTVVTGDIVEKASIVLLYLVDPKNLSLELKSVSRRVGSVSVKAKTGDIFDQWVMRQAQPLLVEEPSKDFRFPEISLDRAERPLGSLIAVPLMTETRLIGVLRAESDQSGSFTTDDLRLVHIIGDLAALGIENSRLYSQMAELAVTDDLTKLSVRRHFEKRLDEEIARAKEVGKPLAVLLIDIDHFKNYNDNFGHSAGDKLLKYLSLLLVQSRRPGEVTARFGGEELAWLIPGADQAEAQQRAEEYRRQIESAKVELRRSMTGVTVSIGAAVFPQDGQVKDALLQTADDRLYKAKEAGRNRVCLS